MIKKKFDHPVVRFYSHVGTPHFVFFIAIFLMLISPVFSTNKYSLISAIFESFYIGSIFYLAKYFKPRNLRLIGFLVLLAIVIVWISYFGIKLADGFDSAILLLLLGLSIYYVFKSMLQTNRVDLDTVLSAASGYILIGISFGILFFVLEVFNPESFTGEEFSYYDARYFAFVTMSTLGYGDITPISEMARSLVIITTLFGQFYMAIIVGIIVGKFISSR